MLLYHYFDISSSTGGSSTWLLAFSLASTVPDDLVQAPYGFRKVEIQTDRENNLRYAWRTSVSPPARSYDVDDRLVTQVRSQLLRRNSAWMGCHTAILDCCEARLVSFIALGRAVTNCVLLSFSILDQMYRIPRLVSGCWSLGLLRRYSRSLTTYYLDIACQIGLQSNHPTRIYMLLGSSLHAHINCAVLMPLLLHFRLSSSSIEGYWRER